MSNPGNAVQPRRRSIKGNPLRIALVGLGGGAAAVLILLPLGAVFTYALREGLAVYWSFLTSPDALHAIGLTLLASAVAVPVSTLFGISAAWCVGKFRFAGRGLLISVIELPLSLSPVIFGVAYLFVFGMQGVLGPWLDEYGISLAFNVSGIVLVTTMVCSPFVFREVLPLMESQGAGEELAAVTLGAGLWSLLRYITLPNVRWAALYGITLCLARSLGEFGAVAVVSGAVRGETNTITLHIELLSNDRIATGAFAIASLLTSLALFTLLVKFWVERRSLSEQAL